MMKQLMRLLAVGLISGVGSAGPARGQAAGPAPAAGFALREVPVLSRVAEPGGGLIPYRQGTLWGYADSTGRVWIQPSLPDEPTFFVHGLATLSLIQPIDARTSRVLGTVLLNARGECLRLGPQQVAVLRPDSTLEKKERAAAVGQRIVSTVYFNWGGAYWGISRAEPQGAFSGRAPGVYVQHHLTRQGERYSVHNAKGKLLTKQFYTSISRFQGPWARFEGEGIYERQQDAAKGMLNRQGQEVGGRFYAVSGDYSATLAAVAQHPDGGGGLIDTTGRFVLGPSADYTYAVPDSAGLVLRAHWEAGPGGNSRRITGYDFVRLDGSLAFPGLPLFSRPSGFGTNDRQPLGPDLALIYAPTGLGILERSGRWRVAPRYASLGQITDYNKRPHTSFYNSSSRDNTDLDLTHTRPPELGVLLAERDGKLGMVRLRDGQEIIPPRYDPPVNYGQPGNYPLYRGFAGFSRAGQDYLVNARGQEVAKGMYRGWDFRVQGRRYLYLELDKSSAENGRAWVLVDTAGRPYLPPLARESQLLGVSAAGLLLVNYLDTDAAGRTSVSEAVLNRQGHEVMQGIKDLSVWRGLLLAGTGNRRGGRAPFLRLFDAIGQPLGTLYGADTLRRARVLTGHPASATDSLVVLDGRGRRWATLPPTWRAEDWPGQPPFRWQGRLVPIEANKRKLGYLTRGGVRLWQD